VAVLWTPGHDVEACANDASVVVVVGVNLPQGEAVVMGDVVPSWQDLPVFSRGGGRYGKIVIQS
jgi:hypothetical protein